MYFWKCWRDSRSTFFILTGSLIAISALTATFNACSWEPGVSFRRPDPATLTQAYNGIIWNGTIANFAMMSSLVLPMMGALLGAYGVGVDFQNGTAIFLATRPRPRWYYLAVSWSVGLIEIVACATLSMMTMFFLLFYFTRSVPNWKFLAMWPLMVVAGTILFSLTGYVGVSQRKGRDAAGAVFVLWVAYIIVGAVLQSRWRISMPQIWDMFTPFISGPTSGNRASAVIPWGAAALWMLTLPVCAGLSWLSFERAEI